MMMTFFPERDVPKRAAAVHARMLKTSPGNEQQLYIGLPHWSRTCYI